METPAQGPVPQLGGRWTGTGRDRLGLGLLAWQVVQSGGSITGTVTLRPENPTDGSCGSCHKSKDGTLTGTLRGTDLELTLLFPTGGEQDPTPECSIMLIGRARVSDSGLTGTYDGTDPCEGVFDGTLVMTREP